MNYYKVNDPKRNACLKIVSVVIVITIVAISIRFESRSDVTPRIIYQDADIADKAAMISIAPGVSIYVPGTNCNDEYSSDSEMKENLWKEVQ